MKKIIILIAFVIISCSSMKKNNVDVYQLEKRLPILVESIAADTLFKSHLTSNFGELTSFFVNDTLMDVFIDYTSLMRMFQKKLYPDSSNFYGLMKYYQWKHESSGSLKNTILKTPKEFKSPDSNYLITLNIADKDIFIFCIEPMNVKLKEYLYGYLIFTKDNKIMEFKTEILTIN